MVKGRDVIEGTMNGERGRGRPRIRMVSDLKGDNNKKCSTEEERSGQREMEKGTTCNQITLVCGPALQNI